MSEAPERIWAGNWLADVGETATWDMGEWRNEPWPTVNVVKYVRADLYEKLEAENNLLKTSGIIEVAVRNPNVMEYMKHWEGRAEAAEEKLAVAVEALGTALSEMVDYADTHPAWSEIWEAREAARTTLAELKGETDEWRFNRAPA